MLRKLALDLTPLRASPDFRRLWLAQSLAEATLEPDQATERHYHRASEEIYFLLEGEAEMELDGERRRVGPGDAVLIPPGAWHEIRALEPLRFLCCCAPPYRHEDTYFE